MLQKFEKLLKRLKFSNEEKRIADFLFMYRDVALKLVKLETEDGNSLSLEDRLRPFKFILVDNIKDGKIHEKITELLKYINRFEYMKYLEPWPIPVFPINGEMLASKKSPKDPCLARY